LGCKPVIEGVERVNFYFPLPVFLTAVVLFEALGVTTFLFFSPWVDLTLLLPKNLLLIIFVFIKIVFLILIGEKKKNKRAGPANHSLTTLLQNRV